MASIGIDFTICGFGYEGGLLPNVRLGVVRIWWCRGSLFARIAKLHVALGAATRELKR